MDHRRRHIVSFILLIAIAVAAGYFFRSYITFENIKNNRDLLHHYVESNFTLSAVLFVFVFICTGFFLPGALVLTVAGGFLFGTFAGAVLVNIGGLSGATLAFLTSRYLTGNWVQRKYKDQLRWFNGEVERHGLKVLAAARFIPLFPFFLVNYFAGLTKMRLIHYIGITGAAMLPGSIILSFAGRRLATINRPEDIVSKKFVFALLLAGLLVLMPVIVDQVRRRRR